MKKITSIIVCCFTLAANAQNVGIGNTNPQTALDINGDLALRMGSITLSAATNANVNTTTNKKSFYRVAGPSTAGAGFTITGFTGGVDGRTITLINTTVSPMILENGFPLSSSAAANQIITSDGLNLDIPTNGAVTLIYDGTASRWRVSNYSKPVASASAGGWNTNGNDIYNINSGNVGIGSNAPLNKLSVTGNADFSGNVGIGNSTPLAKLDIAGDIRLRSTLLTLPAGLNNNVDINTVKSAVYMFAGGALGGCQITGFTAGADGRFITIFNNSTTAAIQLYDQSNATNPSADANKILTGTGNSAIVYQNGSVTLRYDGAKQRWTVTGSNYTDGLATIAGSGTSGWALTGNAGTTAASFIGTTDNTPLIIKTNNVTAVNISTDGNVGIGTTPGGAAKLWLSGSDNGIFLYGANGAYTGSIGTLSGNFVFESDGDLVIKSALGAPLINRPFKNIILNPPPPNSLYSVGNVGIGNATPTNKLSVVGNADFSGNVGIGTTNPTSKLSVNGNIRAKEIVVESINWPDYVFEDNYELSSLDSVEQHIKTNKHLTRNTECQ